MFGLTVSFAPATASTRSSGADDTSKLEALGWHQQHTLAHYITSSLKQKDHSL